MKKILALLLLGVITLNANLFSMEEKAEKQDLANPTIQTQLTKMDYVKIGLASLASGSFATIAISSILSLYLRKVGIWTTIAGSTSDPLFNFADTVLKFKPSPELDRAAIGITGTLSALIAGCLGLYVYKKISTLRRKNSRTNANSTEFL